MSELVMRCFRVLSVTVAGLGLAHVLRMPVRAASRDSPPGGSLYQEPLSFIDDAGVRLDLSNFRGRQIILSMFYTRCRSTCPATLGKLRQIERAFAEHARPIEIVVVSYDSADNPRRLAHYRNQEQLPAAWHLLSGRPDQVERLAQRIGLGRYLNMGDHIFHSYRIVLVDEAGVVRRALDPDHNNVLSLFEDAAGASPAPEGHP